MTTNAIVDVVEAAMTADEIEHKAITQSNAYESVYVRFVECYLRARNEGVEQQTIVKAIKDEADKTGTTPHVGSTSSMVMVDALATFHALDGDLPTAWVYRPASQNAVGVFPGESSVHSLIRHIIQPPDRVEVLKAEGVQYGKRVTDSILRSSENKTDAIRKLRDLRATFEDAVRTYNTRPDTAEKYLKQIISLLPKVDECLDAGQIKDVDKIRSLANGLLEDMFKFCDRLDHRFI